MSTRIRVEMKPVNTIVARLGVNKTGDVQRFVTNEINRRLPRYMPFRTGNLATKTKFVGEQVHLVNKRRVISPTEIYIGGPYARYQYYGKVMVNAETGKGPMNIPGVGLRYKEGTKLKATDRDLTYDKGKNPAAGPKWDKALMAAEGDAIAADVQAYINRKAGKA